MHGSSDSLTSTQFTRLLQWPCADGFPGGTSSSVPAGTITRVPSRDAWGIGRLHVAQICRAKLFASRQIEAPDQIFALRPMKLGNRHRDVGRAHAAGRLAATRTITVTKAHERRAHLVAHRLAQRQLPFKVCSAIEPPLHKSMEERALVRRATFISLTDRIVLCSISRHFIVG